jgi:arylsulfatase A-like enzyme
MGPETLSSGKLELLSPKNLHYGSNFARMILPDGAELTQADHLAASQAIAILESRAAPVAEGARNLVKLKPEAPFFLAVGFVRPHVPLIAPESCFEPYPAEHIGLPEVLIGENVPEAALRRRNGRIWGMDDEQKRKAIGAYYASVRFMDRQVGRLLEALDRLGLRENTIVVFISDHGYNLGEHDCWSKVSLWEGSIRVPVIISAPGFEKTAGSVVDDLTELIDLYPTLADLSGVEALPPAILQGRSLVPHLRGESMSAEPEFAAYTISYGGRAASIRTNRWRFTLWEEEQPGMNEELYDHHNDPQELVNLAGDPDYRNDLNQLRGLMQGKRSRAGSGFVAR